VTTRLSKFAVAKIYWSYVVVFVLFLLLFVLYVCNNYIQLWAASIDGLRPNWQRAIIYTVLSTMYISSLANKIVVV